MSAINPIIRAVDELADAAVLERLHPLVKMIINDELALLYQHTIHSYSVFLRFGDRVSKERARDSLVVLGEEIKRSQILSPAERKVASDRVHGMFRQAAEELKVEELRAVNILKKRALTSARTAADRAKSQLRGDRALAILEELEASWVEIPNLHASLRKALEQFLIDLPVTDHTSWMMIANKLAGFRGVSTKLKEIQAAGVSLGVAMDAWRKMARGEASGLKGFLQERAFWRSPGWLELAPELMGNARRRAARLFGFEATVLPITEPLRTLESGGEIYDGVIMITRPTKDPSVLEGFLDTVIQIKSEKDVSVLQQIERDLGRESRRGSRFQVRLQNERRQSFVIRPAPDQLDLNRIFVAPELPRRAAVEQMPAVKAKFLPTLLDADQMDEVAFSLLLIAARVQ